MKTFYAALLLCVSQVAQAQPEQVRLILHPDACWSIVRDDYGNSITTIANGVFAEVYGGPGLVCLHQEPPSPILVLPNGDAVLAVNVVAIKAFVSNKYGDKPSIVVIAITEGGGFGERRELHLQSMVASDDMALSERDRLIEQWRKVVEHTTRETR